MRKPFRYALVLTLLLVFAAVTWQAGYSQENDSRYFPQLGHSVEGAFLDFYQAASNPEVVYGYPISEAFTNPEGLRVQYFQRARFELRSDGAVVLTPVGRALYHPGRPLADFNPSPAACRDFETGFPVCMSFLAFFDTHGGLGQFGRPISSIEQDGLRYVQYFEYARLEWYPESDGPHLEVQLGPLGRLYFDFLQEDHSYLGPIESFGIIEVTTLRVHAFPAVAAFSGAGTQPVFVIVQDQLYAPVGGAEIQTTATYPDGNRITFSGSTNAHGFIEIPLPVDGLPDGVGLVLVEAAASFAGAEQTTRTSFRITP